MGGARSDAHASLIDHISMHTLQRYGLYFFLFLLPIHTRWIIRVGSLNGGAWEYGTISLYATEVLLIILAVLAIAHTTHRHPEEDRVRSNRAFPFYFIIAGLIIAATLSLLWASDRVIGAWALARIVGGALLVFIIARTDFHMTTAARWFVAGGVTQASLAVYQFVTQYIAPSTLLGVSEHIAGAGGTSVVETVGLRMLRAYGTFPHPNMLGMYLVISIMVALTLTFVATTRAERAVYWGSIVLMLHGLFFTFSRSAVLALVIGSAFLFAFVMLNRDGGSKVQFANYVFIVLTVLGLLTFLHRDAVWTRVNGAERLERQSAQERSLYAAQSRDILIYRWVTGVGIGNYTFAVHTRYPGFPAWEYQPVHNVYMLVLAEVGIIGFVLLVLLFVDTLKTLAGFRIDYGASLLEVYAEHNQQDMVRAYSFEFHWFLCFGAILLMWCAQFFFDHFAWTLPVGIYLFWFSVGMFVKQASYVRR